MNKILIPSTRSTLSMLYPNDPSIVENTSFVTVSKRSTVFFASVPKLYNFNPALNSIIALLALVV